jgi:hypothetical protein
MGRRWTPLHFLCVHDKKTPCGLDPRKRRFKSTEDLREFLDEPGVCGTCEKMTQGWEP